MRDDAKNFRVMAEKVIDVASRQSFLRRADQCERAAKILELYAQYDSTP